MTLDDILTEESSDSTLLRRYCVEEVDLAVEKWAYVTTTSSQVEDYSEVPEMDEVPKPTEIYISPIAYSADEPGKIVDGQVAWYARAPGYASRVPAELIGLAAHYLRQGVGDRERQLDEIYNQVCGDSEGRYEDLLRSENPLGCTILHYFADKLEETSQFGKANEMRTLLDMSFHGISDFGLFQ
ncbi:MAG: hypothetical protein AABX51_02415 [Nanoarchaeota archaeon]